MKLEVNVALSQSRRPTTKVGLLLAAFKSTRGTLKTKKGHAHISPGSLGCFLLEFVSK